MNERIEELAQGCFEYFEGTLDGDIVEFNYKKFAELIIRECAAMTRNLSAHGELAEKAVKEHFGVEE